MIYQEIEQMAINMLHEYAGDALTPYYERHVVGLMCNVVLAAHPKTKQGAEDIIRGMCHIFVYGMDCRKDYPNE